MADPGGALAVVVAAWISLSAMACSHEAGRTVLVEADTTKTSRRAIETAGPEVVVLEPEPVAPPERSAGGDDDPRKATGAPAAERPAPAAVPGEDPGQRGEPRPEGRIEAGAAEGRRAAADLRDEGAPPRPIVLPSGRAILPAGTVLQVELRTPIHTATTLIGDRFAARLTEAVRAGDRVVLPEGALVEGRVARVGSANEPGRFAYVELDARSVRTARGQRLPIIATVLSVAGHEVLEPRPGAERAGAVAAASAGAAAVGVLTKDARAAVLAGILGGIAGRAIVARTADREIIVPSGAPLTLELVEPLEVPAGA